MLDDTEAATPVSPRLPAERFLYRQIADQIADAIASGVLPTGTLVPSVRKACATWDVSVPTILQAYRLLEARGLIEPRARSGYFVRSRRVEHGAAPRNQRPLLKPTPVRTGDMILDFLEAVAEERHLPLGSALPDAALLPTGQLARTLATVTRRDRVRSAMHAAPSGAEELRRMVAHRLIASRVSVGADDVVVTNGAMEAVSLGLRVLTRPGDTVAVESPAYFGTLQIIQALGLKALEIPTDSREGIDVEVLDAALKRRKVAAAVLTPNVHNPLGFVLGDARRRQLAKVLDAHRLPVVEDETYAELAYDEARPPSLRAYARVAPIVSCGSFSKTLASGYRVGWMVPGAVRNDVLRLKAATTVATSMPAQLAIAEFLRVGGYDHHLRRLRMKLKHNVERVRAEVLARFPHETRVSSPDGGFLLWIELPESADAARVYEQCRTRGVSIAPGPLFSASGAFRHFLRLNAGLLWSSELARAIQVVADVVAAEASAATTV